MRFTIAALAMVGMITFSVFSARGTAAAQSTKSQWDGVYTEEQAKRGEALFSEHCSSCHGADLAGGDMAPGLSGSEFNTNWNDLTLSELFERIWQTMPADAPGSLSRPQSADILAYMLSKSAAPAGTTELPAQSDVLTGIKYIAQKPAP